MMRPLWYEFPGDEAAYGREGISMVGNALLAAPVLKKGATQGERVFCACAVGGCVSAF